MFGNSTFGGCNPQIPPIGGKGGCLNLVLKSKNINTIKAVSKGQPFSFCPPTCNCPSCPPCPFCPPPRGCLKSLISCVLPLCVLCEALCDPLCFSDLKLNTKGTKVCTKAHKGLFQQPQGGNSFNSFNPLKYFFIITHNFFIFHYMSLKYFLNLVSCISKLCFHVTSEVYREITADGYADIYDVYWHP